MLQSTSIDDRIDANILNEIKNIAIPGRTVRHTCPACSHSRKPANRKIKCFTVTNDGDGIVFNCFHCGVSDCIPLEDRPTRSSLPSPRPKNSVVMMVKEKSRLDVDKLGEKAVEWLGGRGISEETARVYGVKQTVRFMQTTGRKEGVICFPYFNSGEPYAWKMRAVSSKAFQCSGAPSTLFGIEHVEVGEPLIIVEGEMDVLAMREAGIYSVGLPHGSLDKPLADGAAEFEDTPKLKALWEAREHIEAAPYIYIALDDDKAGNITSEEIARRVGKEKCWRVSFGEHNDANGALLSGGSDLVKDIVAQAEPWPVSGLYDAMSYKDEVMTLYDKGLGKGLSTGYASIDTYYTIAPGQLTVVTGVPGSGKSELLDQILLNMAEREGHCFALCSFENEPYYHIPKLISKRLRKPFFNGSFPRATSSEVEAAYEWVNRHFCFLHQKDGSLTDIEDIIDRIKASVLRYGVRGVVIDPYNFISKKNKEMSETDWVSEMLTKLKLLATSLDLHIWFVAHPTKMQRGQDGKVLVPSGYDISGSANWFNKTDCGITVHRPDNTSRVDVHVWKMRFAWLGKKGQCSMAYNPISTTYEEVPEESGVWDTDF
jgi:twinkle protein